MTSSEAPAGRALKRWRWPLTIAAAAALVAVAITWATRPESITPQPTPAAAGTVFLAPGLSTRTDADVTDKKVTIRFGIKNVGSVPADIAGIAVHSRPGMQLVSATDVKLRLAPGNTTTVAITYAITNCGQAMSPRDTGPVPVIVNVAHGTVTKLVEPTTQNPDEPWELFAAEQVCAGPTLTQTSP